jgi:6-phosphogluconate dehydrogenase (decarboxylating)
MQDVLERSGGTVRLWPATLYGSLKRLIQEGLIAESGEGRWTIKTAIDEAFLCRCSPPRCTRVSARAAKRTEVNA